MSIFDETGRFFVGCNYWASHAGTAMWSDWSAETVEADFRRLEQAGLQVVRVFPLWPDFQPLTLLRQGSGKPKEYRFGEQPLPDDEAGRAGMNPEAVARFGVLCDLAERHGLRLIVGLVTGWMSGRFFAPQPLEGCNVLTDPEALRWELRMVKYMVRHFRTHPAIVAWDLGNECNCMAELDTAEQAYVWTALISDAIRSEDPDRPIVSGMHSLHPDKVWRMQDQGELTDVLTTHPYPLFTPHCDVDPINTIRTGLHAACESLYYAQLGGKPCFVEECGTLGPMFASEEVAADFVRNNLLTLWAHDLKGFLWWCAFDQKHLVHAPYDWNSVERELGLFRRDGAAKPVAAAMGEFARFMRSFPYLPLPPRLTDGVCLLTEGQDVWGTAYMTFILAKRAGLELTFAHASGPIPDAPLYLLPNLCGDRAVPLRRMEELLEKVRAGATLYLSINNGLLCPFTEYTGLQVLTRSRAEGEEAVRFDGTDYLLRRPFRLRTAPAGAEVLASDQEGLPAFTRAQYGKGAVYLLAFPLEQCLLDRPGVFTQQAPDYSAFYRTAASTLRTDKKAESLQRNVCVTEHPLEASKRLLVVVNYQPEQTEARLRLQAGWRVTEEFLVQGAVGQQGEVRLNIPRNSGGVLVIES